MIGSSEKGLVKEVIKIRGVRVLEGGSGHTHFSASDTACQTSSVSSSSFSLSVERELKVRTSLSGVRM